MDIKWLFIILTPSLAITKAKEMDRATMSSGVTHPG